MKDLYGYSRQCIQEGKVETKKSLFVLTFAFLMITVSAIVAGSHMAQSLEWFERWFPYVPQPDQVDLAFWTVNQTAYIDVTIGFGCPCYIISNWGVVEKEGNTLWVDSEILKWGGYCIQVVPPPVSHTYDLGYLEEGIYTFTFMAWNVTVKSINFTVAITTWEFDVVLENIHYPVFIFSNSTVSNFNFNETEMQISFNVTGQSGTTGYCNVTIPKSLLKGIPWTIKVDNTTITDFEKTNGTHTFLYFTYTHESPLQVTIEGKWVVPEFPSATILPLFITLSLITAVFFKYRKKQ